ncbi:TPA: RulB protein [Pseudomonas aeruginosa]|nr:RulB protein [Pseudomonas aeruginosa]
MAFILFDAHNFYVSAQLVWQPEFIGKPVVVIGSNDGCVISRSPEAKKLGIAMGEPAHFVREEFWRENVKFFSANFALYGDMSSRMMAVIEQLVPKMRIYSIDKSKLYSADA